MKQYIVIYFINTRRLVSFESHDHNHFHQYWSSHYPCIVILYCIVDFISSLVIFLSIHTIILIVILLLSYPSYNMLKNNDTSCYIVTYTIVLLT